MFSVHPNYNEIKSNNYEFYKNWTSTLELPSNFDVNQFVSNLSLSNNNNNNNNDSLLDIFPEEIDGINIPEDKYTIFEYIQKFIPDFYEKIDIDYQEFFNNKYNIAKTIRAHDELFFNKNKLIDDDIKQYIDDLYKEYIQIFEQLFDDENHVSKFLNNNTNGNQFVELVNNYSIFSPLYIAKILFNNLLQYKDMDKPKNEIINIVLHILENDKNNVKKILQDFKKDIIIKFLEYNKRKNDVEYYLLEDGDDIENFKVFTTDIMYLVIFYSRKLIKLDIYPIHKILSNILEKYIHINLDNLTHTGKISYMI